MVATTANPGVTVDLSPPPPALDFRTGVAAFVGFGAWSGPAVASAVPDPVAFTSWQDFADVYRGLAGAWASNQWHPDATTWNGVQAFFLNGGQRCWIALADPGNPSATSAVANALAAIVSHGDAADDVDLVCAPALMDRPDRVALQNQLIASWQDAATDSFLILDGPPPGADDTGAIAQLLADLRAACTRPSDAALYYPWVVVGGDFELAPGATGPTATMPPSGHVAGMFAGVDERVGVHKAPANEELDGLIDVARDVDRVAGANPLLAVPGRGIRAWGAATLSPPAPFDGNTYVNVRRLVITLRRWLAQALAPIVFEGNDFRLWVRVTRELTAKLTDLYLRGALQGATPDQAFSVKCDAENNPDTTTGVLAVDIQIAPAFPAQFIQIRLIRDASGSVVVT